MMTTANFKNKNGLFMSMLLLLFASITFITGVCHEPWADEAQAWLIARDASVFEILSSISRIEGTTPLWYFILKGLMVFDFPYSGFFLLPWIFGVVGVGIFLFKSPFPNWVKVLFPFTYFVVFQYAVVARQYSIGMSLLFLIASLYEKRHEHPFWYAFVLCLFAFSSTPGLLISGSLYFFFLCETNFLKENKMKNWQACGGIFIFFALCLLIIFPDFQSYVMSIKITQIPVFEKVLICMPSFVAQGFFSHSVYVSLTNVYLFIMAVLFVGHYFYENKNGLCMVACLYIPLILFYSIIYYAKWHCGYLFLLFFFCMWIFYHPSKFENLKDNVWMGFLFVLLFVQSAWGVFCVLYDVKHSYNAGKQVAEIITPYVQAQKQIIGSSYWSVSVQPYFPANIYSNFERSFWQNKNGVKEKELMPFVSKTMPDVVIVHPLQIGNFGAYQEKAFVQKLKNSNAYDKKSVSAYMVTKGEPLEDHTIDIYIKKGL